MCYTLTFRIGLGLFFFSPRDIIKEGGKRKRQYWKKYHGFWHENQNEIYSIKFSLWRSNDYLGYEKKKKSGVSGERLTCYSCVDANYNFTNTVLRTKNKVWPITDRNHNCQML